MSATSNSSITLLMQLLDKAFDLEPSEREEFLCGTTVPEEYRQDLRKLLLADGVGSLLDNASEALSNAAAEALSELEAASNVKQGQAIGQYRLMRLLGEGGIASVWLAERVEGAFRHQVAVKCLKVGLATPASRKRFLREQRILAQLRHPNIAQLHDVGVSSDGVPFIVMEWIDGVSLIRHCNDRQLTVAQRLGLFQKVCAAVHYAHQSLIVHRDLKPGNILVGADGEPKLLDFGIAKLLTETDDQTTRTGVNPMTPAYAAPEQYRGEMVTTAVDVYALGGILYELLTGIRAHNRNEKAADPAPVIAPSEALRQKAKAAQGAKAGRAEAERVRTLLRGDLDTIILTALQPQPERRYPGVQALNDDIARYQSRRPILARKDVWTYRLNMFLRRYWLIVLVSLGVVLFLCGSLVAVLWQMRLVEYQRDMAQHERDDSERESLRVSAVENFMFRLLRQEKADAKVSVSTLLEQAESTLVSSAETTVADRAMAASVLLSLYRSRADMVSALRVVERTADIDTAALTDYAAAELECLRASVLTLNGDGNAALAFAQRGIARAERTQGRQRRIFSNCLAVRGGIARQLNDVDGAIRHFEQSLGEMEKLPAQMREDRSAVLDNLANTLVFAGRYEEAERAYRSALSELNDLHLGESRQAAALLGNLASLYNSNYGRPVDAAPLYEKALAVRWRAIGASASLAQQLINFAGLHTLLSHPERAMALLDRAEEMQGSLVKPVSMHYAQLRLARGKALTAMRKRPEAKVEFSRARELLVQLLPADHELHQALRNDEAQLALIDPVDRRDLARFTTDLAKDVARMRTPKAADAPQLPRTVKVSADIAFALGDIEQAHAMAEEARALYAKDFGESAWQTAQCDLLLGELAMVRGQRDFALQKLKTAQVHLSASLGSEHPLTLRAQQMLVSASSQQPN